MKKENLGKSKEEELNKDMEEFNLLLPTCNNEEEMNFLVNVAMLKELKQIKLILRKGSSNVLKVNK